MTALEHYQLKRFFRNAWLRAAGQQEEPVSERKPGLALLLASEWSPRFERLVRNRLVMGGMRYGLLESAATRGVTGLAVQMARDRLHRFLTDGNGEHLVDAAALCVVAFEGRDWVWRPADRS